MSKIYTSYDELPIMLSVPQLATALGISRSGAYALVQSAGFPALKIGSRIVVPKDKLQDWIMNAVFQIRWIIHNFCGICCSCERSEHHGKTQSQRRGKHP